MSGEHKEARYIEGHGKSGPGKSGDYCTIVYFTLVAGNFALQTFLIFVEVGNKIFEEPIP